MIKKFIILIIFVSGCTSLSLEEEYDYNNDGNIDARQYQQGDAAYIDVYQKNSNRLSARYYWDKDNRLVKKIYYMQSQEFTAYITGHRQVYIDGVLGWKASIDMNRTYPNATIRENASQVFLYTIDKNIIVSESDKNQDGVIDHTSILRNFKAIEDYAGPYRGLIKELAVNRKP